MVFYSCAATHHEKMCLEFSFILLIEVCEALRIAALARLDTGCGKRLVVVKLVLHGSLARALMLVEVASQKILRVACCALGPQHALSRGAGRFALTAVHR